MVGKKTTTKTTIKKASNTEKKTIEELRADLLLAKKGLHDGTLSNPHHIKAIRKEIARKLTAENAAKKGEK